MGTFGSGLLPPGHRHLTVDDPDRAARNRARAAASDRHVMRDVHRAGGVADGGAPIGDNAVAACNGVGCGSSSGVEAHAQLRPTLTGEAQVHGLAAVDTDAGSPGTGKGILNRAALIVV